MATGRHTARLDAREASLWGRGGGTFCIAWHDSLSPGLTEWTVSVAFPGEYTKEDLTQVMAVGSRPKGDNTMEVMEQLEQWFHESCNAALMGAVSGKL